MKCVVKDAVIKRVPDEAAVELVSQGWKYCPKSDWKGKKDQKAVPTEAEKAAVEELNQKKNPKRGLGKGKKGKLARAEAAEAKAEAKATK